MALELGILRVTVSPSVEEALVKLKSVPTPVVANDNQGVAKPVLVRRPVSDGVCKGITGGGDGDAGRKTVK